MPIARARTGPIRALMVAGLVVALASCATPAEPARPPATPIAVVLAGTVVAPAPLRPSFTPGPAPTATATPAATIAPPSPVPTATATPAATIASPSPTPVPTPLDEVTRQQIFTEVWTTIDENYLYADFHGVDWSAVRAEFAPLLAEAGSDAEFFRLIGEMVGHLGDDHSRFLPPQAAEKQDELSSGHEEQVGIGVIALPLADALLIQHVFADSPADRAGLRPRDRIVSVDGEFYARNDLQGPEGSRVRLTVVRPGESEGRDVELIRRTVEGRLTPYARRLPGDIGYLSVTTLWVNDMADQVGTALATINAPRPLNGLIIDLRSNPGGWRSVLTGMLSHFVSGNVGNFLSRKGAMPLLIEPGARPDLRGLPLVVLVDRSTASYAELLAGVLQQEAGAIVVGDRTAGNTETIYSYELTGGARLWVAQEGFALRDGTDLEGQGLVPDVTITLDWTRYSQDDDPGIAEARRILAGQAGGN